MRKIDFDVPATCFMRVLGRTIFLKNFMSLSFQSQSLRSPFSHERIEINEIDGGGESQIEEHDRIAAETRTAPVEE